MKPARRLRNESCIEISFGNGTHVEFTLLIENKRKSTRAITRVKIPSENRTSAEDINNTA